MILVVDVDYNGEGGVVVGVEANTWDDDRSVIYPYFMPKVEPYVSGEFYRRELPCILKLVNAISCHTHNDFDVIVIDGCVWLGDNPGLGAHLARELQTTVVGIAKTKFHTAEATPVTRGSSLQPLYVTADGMPVSIAAELVRGMHGENRIPTLVKRADSECRAFRKLLDLKHAQESSNV